MKKALEGLDGVIGEPAMTRREYYQSRESNELPDTLCSEENILKELINTVTSRRESDMAWRTRAACIGPQAVYFYAPSHRPERKEQKEKREEQAKKFCDECPVIEQCLDEALANKEKEGIWGGTTENERKRLFRTYY